MRPVAVGTLCCLLLICLQIAPSTACTSFSFQTPDGPIYGTNCDLLIPGDGLVYINQRGMAKRGWNPGTTGKTAHWVSEYGSVTFNLAGREFVWGGMNEAGLVISSMQLLAQECADPDERPPLADGYFVQYILDTCSSVEEAIRVDSLVRLEQGECTSHYMVADMNGNCATLEFLDGKFVCHTGETLPVKALSNMPYARALAAYERGGPRWWWSNPGQSAERFAGAAERARTFDASRDTCAATYAFTTLTRVVAAGHTKWNVVFDIAGREVWYRSVESPAVKHISLATFDLSCTEPLLMLDMNEDLDGDVEEYFEPYDVFENLRIFRTFCGRWGIEVSAEDARDLMQIFETFECAP